MQTTGIRAGDIVRCEVRGQPFHALVKRPLHYDEALRKRVIELEPFEPFRRGSHLPTMRVTSRQVTDHWRKSRRKGS